MFLEFFCVLKSLRTPHTKFPWLRSKCSAPTGMCVCTQNLRTNHSEQFSAHPSRFKQYQCHISTLMNYNGALFEHRRKLDTHTPQHLIFVLLYVLIEFNPIESARKSAFLSLLLCVVSLPSGLSRWPCDTQTHTQLSVLGDNCRLAIALQYQCLYVWCMIVLN